MGPRREGFAALSVGPPSLLVKALNTAAYRLADRPSRSAISSASKPSLRSEHSVTSSGNQGRAVARLLGIDNHVGSATQKQ